MNTLLGTLRQTREKLARRGAEVAGATRDRGLEALQKVQSGALDWRRTLQARRTTLDGHRARRGLFAFAGLQARVLDEVDRVLGSVTERVRTEMTRLQRLELPEPGCGGQVDRSAAEANGLGSAGEAGASEPDAGSASVEANAAPGDPAHPIARSAPAEESGASEPGARSAAGEDAAASVAGPDRDDAVARSATGEDATLSVAEEASASDTSARSAKVDEGRASEASAQGARGADPEAARPTASKREGAKAAEPARPPRAKRAKGKRAKAAKADEKRAKAAKADENEAAKSSGEAKATEPVGSNRLVFPIRDYDALTAKAVLAELPRLSAAQCATVRERERSHKKRKSILRALDARLES